jgi:hypothetical protein
VPPTPGSDPSALTWRKSSFSADGECVEVAVLDGYVAVRNSNDPGADALLFTFGEIGAWVAGIKAGEFDDLLT